MEAQNVQDLFSAVAARLPHRTAIELCGERISYGELERRSNQLANGLLSAGVLPGALVATFTGGSAEVVTSILGILKAGCAFMPLDPHFPDQRLRAMVAETAPSWLVTGASLLRELPRVTEGAPRQPRVVSLDACVAGESDERPSSPMDAGSLSSVYFTSGSTGRPKAIAGRLAGIDHFVRWEIGEMGVGEGTRVSQLVSQGFDGFLRDAFVPLCAGGVLCVPESREAILEPAGFVRWIDGERIEILQCVPSLFRALLNADLHPGLFPSLKYVVLFGEPLLPADVGRWADVFGDRVQLVNLYGPTETTLTKLFYRVRPEDRKRRTIPIGKPIPGAEALVLDERGRSCPLGVVGEIYLRTPYRALGYLKQPELTREVFMPNPLTGSPGDIVYRTGDFGRLLEDGDLEFLGRRDGQVKIRGVRIELTEIESRLREHPVVKDVAVIDIEDASGTRSLCAYLVAYREIDPGELRQHLARELPETMVPSRFLRMESLPRTLNGKISRRALPRPADVVAAMAEGGAPPTGPIEEILAGIWTEVLGLDFVSRGVNFFDVGGHSLLIMQLLSRVRWAFGVELSIRELFDAPTLGGFAEKIALAREAALPPLLPAGRRSPPPLSFRQEWLWEEERARPGSALHAVPLALGISGDLDAAALERALDAVVGRHEILRTTFGVVDGAAVQIIAPPRAWGLPVRDLGTLPEEERGEAELRAIRELAGEGFDLERDPSLRAVLFRRTDSQHTLLLVLHHAAVDESSLQLLHHEIGILYERFSSSETAAPAAPPIQYADYAVWQRRLVEEGALNEQIAHWRQRLEGNPRELELGGRPRRTAADAGPGGVSALYLPADLVEAVRAFARQWRATPFMVLLAGLAALLHRLTGERDFLIGVPFANRGRPETEGMIGPLANEIPFRADLSGDPAFSALLERVRERVLEDHAHQVLPLEILAREVWPDRPLREALSRRVLFNFQSVHPGTAKTTGPALAAGTVGAAQTLRHDLVLRVLDTAQELRLRAEYRTDVIDPVAITSLLEDFATLMRSVTDAPAKPLSELLMGLRKEDAAALHSAG
ncbi:MAG TPA: amino acid adenylation domain-containing protein [Thermoanaerobaculia bacterium]|nr:amino acid adenylation domain-containing protein [Thermoanaerobaculia bacterium]